MSVRVGGGFLERFRGEHTLYPPLLSSNLNVIKSAFIGASSVNQTSSGSGTLNIILNILGAYRPSHTFRTPQAPMVGFRAYPRYLKLAGVTDIANCRLVHAIGRQVGALVGKTASEEVVVEVEEEPVDLGQISAAVHHGCMGLPQELIDHTMEMLHDDLRALKACSLTCKAMFASTRHLIHYTLHLTQRNNQSVLTQEEKCRYLRWDYGHVELRFLSFMGERGFLQYPRHVHFKLDCLFTPDILLHHLDHFQSLDRVHSLTIDACDGLLWRNYHSCFTHFYPTLTSLVLRYPTNHYRYLLQFALQFPNLQNLCIKHLADGQNTRPDLVIPPIVSESPPLRGHLRLVGVGKDEWPIEFTNDLPNGINFRSVELQGVFWEHCQRVLTACANTLEDLTVVPRGERARFVFWLWRDDWLTCILTGDTEFVYFIYGWNRVLRRLTFRLAFPHMSVLPFKLAFGALSTIRSPDFCEFVLELGKVPSRLILPSSEYWGYWGKVDRFFEEWWTKHQDFRLVIRTGKLYDRETFETHAKETFPLSARRGFVRFETSYSIERHWR